MNENEGDSFSLGMPVSRDVGELEDGSSANMDRQGQQSQYIRSTSGSCCCLISVGHCKDLIRETIWVRGLEKLNRELPEPGLRPVESRVPLGIAADVPVHCQCLSRADSDSLTI